MKELKPGGSLFWQKQLIMLTVDISVQVGTQERKNKILNY
jgi:hypothetical protein